MNTTQDPKTTLSNLEKGVISSSTRTTPKPYLPFWLISLPITALTGGFAAAWRALKDQYDAKSAPNITEYIRNLYTTKTGYSLAFSAYTAAFVALEDPQHAKETLKALIEDRNKAGVETLLEANYNKFGIRRIPQSITMLNEAKAQALSLGADEIAKTIELSADGLQRKLDHNLSSDNASPTLNNQSLQSLTDVQANTNSLIQHTNKPLEPVSATTSSDFTINSIIATAMVLKICGLDKFLKFSLPPTPIQITRDYELPTNHWTPQEFEQLIQEDPKAKIIATAVTNQMRQSGATNWSPEQVVEFVRSPAFKSALEITRTIEQTSRKATEADFGIDTSQNKKPSTKHKKLRGK